MVSKGYCHPHYIPQDENKKNRRCLRNVYFYFITNIKLVDILTTHIRYKNFWYTYTLLCLVVLKQRSNDSRKCHCRSIQRVAKLSLLVGSLITALQTVCLICVEVGNRRNLQPSLLSCRINLEVVASSGCETHIATA